jgi:GNAT superfamily N-acetyltransferase
MAHPAPTVTLRRYDPVADAPRLAELLTAEGPEPVTVAQLREWERLRSPEAPFRAVAAVAPDGAAVGFAQVSRAPWAPPGHFALEGVVDAAHRQQGVGGRLLADATAFARAHGGTRLDASVRDHRPDAQRFLERRGFAVDRHVFESTLDLAGFDEAPFAGAVARAEAAGLVFRSLADYGDTEAARRRLYDLNTACVLDIPGHDGSVRPWEEFRKIFEMAWYRPDGQVLAVDPAAGERFAALAAIGYFAETNSVYHMHTGVDRAYRGRGLALATKVVALRRARAWGAAYARTNNDSQNAPILAVNRRLGYVPQPGFYQLVRVLT